jgi:hypothetical protein
MMLAMTRPISSSKLVLLEDRRAGSEPSSGAPVRRYRLARVRFSDAPAAGEGRFEYLKRTHD